MQKIETGDSHTPKRRRQKHPWAKIKKEYMEGASMRSLAKKYGASQSTISERAKKENWKKLKEQIKAKTDQKLIEKNSERQSEINMAYSDAATELLKKTLSGISVCGMRNSKALKEYSSILKDLKDIGVYRTDLDLKEQNARIEKLRKEAKEEEQNKDIRIVIDDEMQKFLV